MQSLKMPYLELYEHAHINACDLLKEAKILFDNKCYPRAYFLAFTALEEISKSQYAADVFTGLSTEEDFKKAYKNHNEKIGRVAWAQLDTPHKLVWRGPDVDDIERIVPDMPAWEKRQDSLYVNFNGTITTSPKDKIAEIDASELIRVVDTALKSIFETTVIFGNNIGTKGFMK
ncbi:AbiV family abortive infection protein [Patescibacteria group bacterium]|nr:AbiV family abortive infection protein [Patescibacteria group bacterium]